MTISNRTDTHSLHAPAPRESALYEADPRASTLHEAANASLAHTSTPHVPSHSHRVVGWTLVAVMACVIFLASAHTGFQLDEGNDLLARTKRWLTALLSDAAGHPVDVSLVGHFTEYFLFGCTLANALWSSVPKMSEHPRLLALASCGIASLYGVTDEIHQLFVPGRCCDPVDWCCDTIAALIGAAIVVAVIHRRRRAKIPRI